MPKSSSAPGISEQKQQAIDWLLRLRSDDMDDEELCAFADWLAQDHANSEAFSEAELLFDQMALAAKPVIDTQTTISSDLESQQTLRFAARKNNVGREKRPRPFFYWMAPALAIAAIWLFVVNLFLPHQVRLLDNWNSDFYTQAGEMLEVQLSDGSRLLLNTNTAVSVNYSDSRRTIILHNGQARFNVAKDSIRPFVVDTDDLQIKALGTIFQIYKDESDAVKITVQEHAVAVSKLQNNEIDDTVTVQTGQQLKYQSDVTLLQAENIELRQETAWQQKRIVINDQPLGDLISELQRYRNGRIFLSDDELKNLRITGVFSLDNPDAVIRSVCKVLNLKQTELAGWWTIVHR